MKLDNGGMRVQNELKRKKEINQSTAKLRNCVEYNFQRELLRLPRTLQSHVVQKIENKTIAGFEQCMINVHSHIDETEEGVRGPGV